MPGTENFVHLPRQGVQTNEIMAQTCVLCTQKLLTMAIEGLDGHLTEAVYRGALEEGFICTILC